MFTVARMMKMRQVCALFCFFSAVITTISAGSEHGNSNGEFELHSNQAVLKNLANVIGYSRISTNKQTDLLFSEDDMNEIILNDNPPEKLNSKDYRDPCAHDLVRVAFGIPTKDEWAIAMIDADGKLPAGVMYGNLAWPGSYSECLAIQAPPDPTDNEKGFGGRYCTLSWTILSQKISISSGLCIPDTCNEADFKNITNLQLIQKSRKILPQLTTAGNSSAAYISLTAISCQPKTTEYDTGAIVLLVILYICLFLVIAGTSLTAIENIFPLSSNTAQENIDPINTLSAKITFDDDTKKNSAENSELIANESDQEQLIPHIKGPSIFEYIGNFLKCFCLITNGSKILDTSDKGGNEFRCLHGIRFLSMAWVILGHTYLSNTTAGILGNMREVLTLLDDLPFLMVLQGPYAVDSFFVLSGFLLTYLFLREMTARDGKISWLAFYLHRYWRLTPVYAIVLAFDTTLAWYFISGPFRPQTYENNCRKGWWWNLLYINNFAKSEDSCMGWGWYLANDMQFYVISPIFLYALWKWPKIGLGIIISLFCGSWIANFTISYHYNLLTGLTLLPDQTNIFTHITQMQLYFDKVYIKPYTRIGPYLIGVFLGYFFYQLKGRKQFLSKKFYFIFVARSPGSSKCTRFRCKEQGAPKVVLLSVMSFGYKETYQAIGWTASTALGLYIIFGMYHQSPGRVGSALGNAFYRCCFSASLAWVIFACLTGHGGAVNKLLSHPVFIPLARLTYCAYLIHPILMSVYYFSLPSTLIFTHAQMVLLFLGFLLASYGIAFATSLMLESPAMAIEKLFRSGSASKRKEDDNSRP